MFIIQQVGERGRLEGKQHPELYRVILLKTYCETNTSLCLCENVRRTWTFAKRSEDKREENVPEHAKGTTFGGKTDKSLSLKLCVLSDCCLVILSSLIFFLILPWFWADRSSFHKVDRFGVLLNCVTLIITLLDFTHLMSIH